MQESHAEPVGWSPPGSDKVYPTREAAEAVCIEAGYQPGQADLMPRYGGRRHVHPVLDAEHQRQWWAGIAKRVTLRSAWPLPIRIVVVTDPDRYDVILRAELLAQDIATGAPTVHTVQHISWMVKMEEPQALEMVARLIHRAVRHELDECLLVDGKQARDPHAGGRER